MTGEYSHGAIDSAVQEELGVYSREELYEVVGDLHDRIVELQADPWLECPLTADDLIDEMYELDDELLLQKVESLRRRVALWQERKIGNQAVQEIIESPRVRREVEYQPQTQADTVRGQAMSDEVLRIRESFLNENAFETPAVEWFEEFGELVPTYPLILKFAEEGKFYPYSEIRKIGGVLALRRAVDELYRPLVVPYGEPEDEIASSHPDATEVVMSGEYSRTKLYAAISDLYKKVAKIENQLEFSRRDIDDIAPSELRQYSKAELKAKAELLCARLNELQRRIVGRNALRKLTEGASYALEEIPMDVIHIRERFLQQDMPETMERAAELWRLKFGDELPTEVLLEEMYEQCLYFSPEVIEDLGGLEELQEAVKYQESVTLYVPRSGEKRKVSPEKSPAIWRFATIEEAAEDWYNKFPDEMPTLELIKEKHRMGLYATASRIHRLGGITKLQEILGYDVTERERRPINEARMNMFVEAWDLLFPGEVPTLKLIDAKCTQKLPGWSWRAEVVTDAGGVKEFRRRLEHRRREVPAEVESEVEEVVERLSTGDMIVINWAL